MVITLNKNALSVKPNDLITSRVSHRKEKHKTNKKNIRKIYDLVDNPAEHV